MSKDNSVKAQDINEWIESTAVFMADNAAKMLREKGYRYGSEVFKALSVLFLARVMTATVIEVTHDIPENITTSAEASRYAKKQFLSVKSDIQDIVGMAFTTATAAALAKPVDFYCEIKIVPDPISHARN